MSKTYGSDTRIIFDLWNEPANPADLTSDPSDPNPLWPILKPYYETLIQTVRNNHAQNIVIATGNHWASWLVGIKGSPLSDPNVVYAYHRYSVLGHNTPLDWNTETGGLVGVKPVIVSEWGFEDVDAGASPQWPGSPATFGIPFTNWLEANKLSSLVWIYHYDWTPRAAEIRWQPHPLRQVCEELHRKPQRSPCLPFPLFCGCAGWLGFGIG